MPARHRAKLQTKALDPRVLGHKTLGESTICFASAIVALTAAALLLQWLMHFLP